MPRRSQRKDNPGPQAAEQDEALSEEELALHTAESVPDRAALSSLATDITIPVDPSLAADVLSGLAGDESEELGEEGGEGDEQSSD